MSRTDLRPMKIQRMSERELDVAITDLQARGYELLKRGQSDSIHKNYDYREASRKPYKFTGTSTHQRCWAVLRKKEEPK